MTITTSSALVLALCIALVAGAHADQQPAGTGAGLAYEVVANDPEAVKGQPVSWLASRVGSSFGKRSEGRVVLSVAFYQVEPAPRPFNDRQYFAIDTRAAVPVTEAAQRLQSAGGDRIIVIRGVVVGTVEAPVSMVPPFEDNPAGIVSVPLIGQARVDAPGR